MGRAAIKLSITEKDTGWDDFQSLLRDIQASDAHVKVGVLEGVGTGSVRRDTGGKRSAQTGIGAIGVGGRIGTGSVAKKGLTNAELAAIHEFGSADGRIPERSFLRSTFNANMPVYLQNLATLLERVFSGKMTVEKAFNIMGAKISTDVKKYITTGAGVPPPNAPSTLARKIAKGAWTKGGLLKTKYEPRTLIDTGRMLAAITWAYFQGGK